MMNAEEVANLLGTKLVPTTAYDFANGETFVRFEESVRGVDAFVIQSHPAPINHWLMEQLLMVDALKRASAKRITVVAPFFPYARQDKKSDTPTTCPHARQHTPTPHLTLPSSPSHYSLSLCSPQPFSGFVLRTLPSRGLVG
jgi:phosphoribosylpyrophosphate synthetase